MESYRERLSALFERKERSIYEMDSFQIVEEIEKTIFELLRSIFAPYPIEMVDERSFTHAPDGLLKFLPLGKRRNFVFLEMKVRKIATFDLKVIREMIKELKANYPTQFHSLLVITKTAEDASISRLSQEFYPDKVEIVSVEALLEIASLLSAEPQLGTLEAKKPFLIDLLESEVLSPSVVRKVLTSIPLKEYSFEEVTGRMMTKDNFMLDMRSSFRVDVQNRKLGVEIIGDTYAETKEKIRALVLSAIEQDVRSRALFEFVSSEEKIHSDIQDAVEPRLSQNGLRLLNLKLTWTYDPETKSLVERSRFLIDECNQVREEINNVQSILSHKYDNWLTNIDSFNRDLDGLTEKYARGQITEEFYQQDMKKLLKEILVLKEKISSLEGS